MDDDQFSGRTLSPLIKSAIQLGNEKLLFTHSLIPRKRVEVTAHVSSYFVSTNIMSNPVSHIAMITFFIHHLLIS